MLDNTSLKNEVKSLKIEVASFSKFEFKAKLRKLLKKLLEFLLSKYFKSFMKYDEKKIKYFLKVLQSILKARVLVIYYML